jgi:hypothetical protein
MGARIFAIEPTSHRFTSTRALLSALQFQASPGGVLDEAVRCVREPVETEVL